MLRRGDNITFGIPTILLDVSIVKSHILAILHKLFEIILTGNLCTSGLDDSPAKAFRVTGIDIGLFKVSGRLPPGPSVAGTATCTGNHGQGTTQGIRAIVHVLYLKQTLFIVIMVHAPYITEVLHQLILLRVDYRFQYIMCFLPFLLIEVDLA